MNVRFSLFSGKDTMSGRVTHGTQVLREKCRHIEGKTSTNKKKTHGGPTKSMSDL